MKHSQITPTHTTHIHHTHQSPHIHRHSNSAHTDAFLCQDNTLTAQHTAVDMSKCQVLQVTNVLPNMTHHPCPLHLFVLLLQFLLSVDHLQHGLDLGEELPPLPVADEEVLAYVALNHGQGQPLFLKFLELLSHQVASAVGLKLGNDNAQPLVSQVLQSPEHPRLEEDLAVSHAVLTFAQLHFMDQEFCGLAAVKEASWDSFWSKNGVPESNVARNDAKERGEGRKEEK